MGWEGTSVDGRGRGWKEEGSPELKEGRVGGGRPPETGRGRRRGQSPLTHYEGGNCFQGDDFGSRETLDLR